MYKNIYPLWPLFLACQMDPLNLGKISSYIHTHTILQCFGKGIVYEMETSRPKERSLLQVEDPPNYLLIQLTEVVTYHYIIKVAIPT